MDPELSNELALERFEAPPTALGPAPSPAGDSSQPEDRLDDAGLSALRAERRELQKRIHALEAQLHSNSHQQEIDRLQQDRQRIEADKQQLLDTHQHELEQVQARLSEELTQTKAQLEQELTRQQQQLRRRSIENVFLAAGGDGSFTREFQALLGDRLSIEGDRVVVLGDDGQPLLGEGDTPLDPQEWLAQQRATNPVVAALFPAPRQGFGGGMTPGQSGSVSNPAAALSQASALDKLRYGLGA